MVLFIQRKIYLPPYGIHISLRDHVSHQIEIIQEISVSIRRRHPRVFSYKFTQQGHSGNTIFLKCTFDMFIFFLSQITESCLGEGQPSVFCVFKEFSFQNYFPHCNFFLLPGYIPCPHPPPSWEHHAKLVYWHQESWIVFSTMLPFILRRNMGPGGSKARSRH